MKRRVLLLLLTVLALLLAACGGQENEEVEPERVVETVVVVATPTAVVEEAADTAPPPDSSSEETAVSEDAPVMEPAPVEGGQPTMTTLTDLNVRRGPGTNYAVVGVLRAGESAAIAGKSGNGYWWKIVCPAGAGGECWASAGAQYSTAVNADGVPVAAAPALPKATQAAAAPTSAASATITSTTNPNATPTTTATATATQETGTAVTPTATATQTNGSPPPTETATYTPTPTATTEQPEQIAPFDNDSLQNPATSVFLSITGNRNFNYSDAISYEEGDQDDWIEFEFPNNSNPNQVVWITLDCAISGSDSAQVRATIYEDGGQTTKIVLCNQGETQLTVDNTKTQQVRIHFGITDENVYATYTLTVVGFR
ncbi:MAG: SH3 domain-containing protein [Chloroflexi bacterium]|nr:SH3 domain-containing protein [Chloroflexota bacterium]